MLIETPEICNYYNRVIPLFEQHGIKFKTISRNQNRKEYYEKVAEILLQQLLLYGKMSLIA
jgi:hypothetical protein